MHIFGVEAMKKIFKWFIIAFVIFFAIGVIGLIFESEEAKEERLAQQEADKEKKEELKRKKAEEKAEKEKEKQVEKEAKKKKEDAEKEDYEKEKPEKESEKDSKPKKDEVVKIEVNETVASADYTAKVQRVKIKDGIMTVVFDWENQSDWDPAHFPLLGYVVVEQDGETLEQVGDTDRQNKQINRNRFDVYDLDYKLIDNSDVTIRIVSTNEYDGSEGTITVSLE